MVRVRFTTDPPSRSLAPLYPLTKFQADLRVFVLPPPAHRPRACYPPLRSHLAISLAPWPTQPSSRKETLSNSSSLPGQNRPSRDGVRPHLARVFRPAYARL